MIDIDDFRAVLSPAILMLSAVDSPVVQSFSHIFAHISTSCCDMANYYYHYFLFCYFQFFRNFGELGCVSKVVGAGHHCRLQQMPSVTEQTLDIG